MNCIAALKTHQKVMMISRWSESVGVPLKLDICLLAIQVVVGLRKETRWTGRPTQFLPRNGRKNKVF